MCSPSTVLGVSFSCPPGTRFQQRSLVCDHENNVQCGDEEEEEEEKGEEVQELEAPRRKREKKGKPTNSGSPKQRENRYGSSWSGKKKVGSQQLFGSKHADLWPPSISLTTQRVTTSLSPQKLTGGLNRKTPAKAVISKSGSNPDERKEKDAIDERGRSVKDLERNNIRFPSFSEPTHYKKPLQKGNSKKLKQKEYNANLRITSKNAQPIETNSAAHSKPDVRKKKKHSGNYWGASEGQKDEIVKNEVGGDASVGLGGGGGARVRAIITLQDSPSATPPTPTSSTPPTVKPTSNIKRSQKAKVTQAPTAKNTYPGKPARTTSNSPPTTLKTNLPSSKPVKSRQDPDVKLNHLQPAASPAPSKEDFVHRLKRKSLKKLRASLLSQVWKDERRGGEGQLKPTKKGERREIGILVEDDDRNRKKDGGGGPLQSGTKPISKTSNGQTNNRSRDTGTSEEVAKAHPPPPQASNAVSTDKSRGIDEATSRVVAKLISQAGRGLEARSKGRHSLHRTTTTPHPYPPPPPPSSTTQIPYIPYIPYTPKPALALQTKSTTTTKPPLLTSSTFQPVMPYSINSIRTGDYVEKTAGLETIPFSR